MQLAGTRRGRRRAGWVPQPFGAARAGQAARRSHLPAIIAVLVGRGDRWWA